MSAKKASGQSSTPKLALLTLISGRKWEQVASLLGTPEGRVEARTGDDFGGYPIHDAARNGAPVGIIRMLIDIQPGGTMIQDMSGGLPLHLTCASPDFSVDTARALLDVYPRAVRTTDIDGDLPIHRACQLHGTAEAVQLLLTAYPGSVSRTNETTNSLPLHMACKGDVALEVVRTLLRAFPEGSSVRDSNGRLPLHLVCISAPSSEAHYLEAVQELLSCYPEGKTTSDYEENLPVDIARNRGAFTAVLKALATGIEHNNAAR